MRDDMNNENHIDQTSIDDSSTNPSHVLDERIAQSARTKHAHRKRNITLSIFGIIALLVGITALAFVFLSPGSFFDENAQQGQAPYKSPAEQQAEIDRIVEQGMFNISIASAIEINAATDEGIAYIENIPANHYNMKVVITLDETGEVLFASKAIAPGTYIESIKLTRHLEPATYKATALFTALNTETDKEEGQAGARVSLVVRE